MPEAAARDDRLSDFAVMLYFAAVTNLWTWVFLGMLGTAAATQLWLARRQIAHVRKHRDAVPSMFAGAEPLTTRSPRRA